MVSTLDTQNARTPLDPHDTLALGQAYRRRHSGGSASSDADDLVNHKQVILYIRSMSEQIILTEKLSVVLGRSIPQQGFYPDLDLTPYGARSKGISRAHARLHLQDDYLYITDLCSDNGTFVAGERLVPDIPHKLRRGDTVTLGCLPIQIYFQ
jgi:pSer/pThr/pTyr-binding forkhead associated (FHA) protein